MKLRVGTNGNGYIIERNITSLPFREAQIVRTYDLINALGYLHRRLWRGLTATSFLNCFHCDFGFNKVDLLHFVNDVSCSTTPWVVSFEHYLPRWNVHSTFGATLLASRKCRKIIALSKFAFNHQCHYLEEHTAYKDEIQSKMCIMHPPQKPLITDYSNKPLDQHFITFTLVGHDFFRKGGMEILNAFDRLIAEDYPVKLNIVSSLEYGDYASRTSVDDLNAARRLIQKLSSHVTHYLNLPNHEVLNLFIHSHVGLLPTYDDTYGYSILESQAAGCPVITTDVCPLPEINNSAIGWVINVPKDQFGIAHRHTKEQRAALSALIQENLYDIIKHICSNPEVIREKGIKALQKIKEQHDPQERADALERIYEDALRRM